MDKLCKYIDRELEDLGSKVASSGKLSSAEINYGKDLAKFKSALLTNEAMGDYSEEGMSNRGGSYGGSYERGGRQSNARGRNARRDSRGRYSSEDGYSRAEEDFIEQLEELRDSAPDEHKRKKVERLIAEMR